VEEHTVMKNNWTTKQYTTLALVLFLIGLIIFGVAFVSMKQGILINNLNQPLLTWMLNHRVPQITNLMIFVTTVLNPLNFLVLVCLIAGLWAAYAKEIWRPAVLVISIGVTAALSTVVKMITASGRPPQIDMVVPFEIDYSFPSGHTIGIGVFLLVVGYLVCSRRPNKYRVIWWLAVAAIGTAIVATSRLYLGYHWLTDVIASVGLGLMVVAAVIYIDRLFIERFKKLK
jgi:undecaprenyl-diphosphatase